VPSETAVFSLTHHVEHTYTASFCFPSAECRAQKTGILLLGAEVGAYLHLLPFSPGPHDRRRSTHSPRFDLKHKPDGAAEIVAAVTCDPPASP